eukprot:TRINITY_DN11923_c0_g1_i1.p1 TRINITY_DN11923_c0_g1~~TRINITY_DN11923_c0_g1_i1.p1  ORF type:complete len:246 (+),score=58.83 TRINITY_DN11923_c0_g1_i1:56-793(+)
MFRDIKWQKLIETLKEPPPRMNKIEFDLQSIGDQHILELSQILQDKPRIRALNVSFNAITLNGALILANSPHLTDLNISFNSIGDDGAIALSKSTTITRLDVTKINIGSKGAIALANNRKIEYLQIGMNSIGIEGLLALAKNQTLKELDIRGTGADDDIMDIFSKNKTLHKLTFGGEDRVNSKWREIIKKQTTTNLIEFKERKKTLLFTLYMLVKDSKNSQSTSLWSMLPPELVFQVIGSIEMDC